MKKINVYLSLSSIFSPILILLVLNLFIPALQIKTEVQQVQCLLEKQVSIKCIRQLNVQQLVKADPQFAVYACPILMDQLEKNIRGGVMAIIQQLQDKAEIACQISVEHELLNGYLLFGLQLIRGPLQKALELQYKLFFNNPFEHQQKFKQILRKYQKYIEQGHSENTPIQEQADTAKIQKAIQLFYQNNIKQSLTYLKSVTNVKNNDLTGSMLYLKFLQIRIMQKNGQFPEALSIINQLINKYNGKIHWYFFHLRGNLLMHHLKFRQAIQSFQKSLASKLELQKSYFGFSMYNIGLCYQKIGDFKKSIGYFKNVLNTKPDAVEALNSVGFSYYSLIEPSKTEKQNKQNQKVAQKYYLKAINTNEDYYMAYYNLGVLKYETGNYHEAVHYFQQAIAKSGDNSNLSSRYGLFKALYKTDKNKALQLLEKEIVVSPEVMFSEIGMLFYQLGQKQKAMEYLHKAIEQKSNLGEVYEWKGIIEYEGQNYTEAKQSFKKALEYGNTKASIWYNLGYIQMLNENYERAVGLLKKSEQLDPHGPAAQQIKQLNGKLKSKKHNKTTDQL